MTALREMDSHGLGPVTLTVIILNFNRWKDTIDCVASVLRSDFDSLRIIVLDNGSNDENGRQLRTHLPKGVDLVALSNNKGVASGWNIAISYAMSRYNPEYIFLLNNDAIVEAGVFKELWTFANEHPRAGSVGPRIVDAQYPFLDQNRRLVGATSPELNYQLLGSALMIRTDVFKDLGFFDEDYFAYWEELDFLERMKRSQYQSYYVPTDARVLHVGAATASRISAFEAYHRTRGALLFAGKNLSGRRLLLFLMGFFLRWMPRSLVIDLQSSKNLELANRRLFAVISGWKGFLCARGRRGNEKRPNGCG
jgi:hypothetical protein